jgi:hypothetical protein
MKLIELNPQWLGNGGEGVTETATGKAVPRREGVGVDLDCPCGCDRRLYVPFKNPLDGGPSIHHSSTGGWLRTGEDFETLTLTPSIQRADPNGCRWHGFITNGEIVNA